MKSNKDVKIIEGTAIPTAIVHAFNKTALDLIHGGRTRFGAFAIINKIRWDMAIAYEKGSFKCSNNWAPLLSRNFAATYPKHAKFFTFKRRKGDA